MDKTQSWSSALVGLGMSFLAFGLARAPAGAQNISPAKEPDAAKVGEPGGASATTSWPDATNTGVPESVTLTPSGELKITQAGAVISGLEIRGPVYIQAPNVKLVNSKITAAVFADVNIKLGVTGTVVQNCEINGVGAGNDGSNGIYGAGTFVGNNIYNVENGITLTDNPNPTVIRNNYIHDLRASGSPHYDGIQIDGSVSNVTISHNTIINSWGQTSAIMIDNGFGPISNISVDDNVLVGGGYTVYSDGRQGAATIGGVSFTNNRMGKGKWGYRVFEKNSPVWQGNVDLKTDRDLGSR